MKKFFKLVRRNPELIFSGIAYSAIAVVSYQLIEVSMYHAIVVAGSLAVIGLCDRIGIKKRIKVLTQHTLAMKKYNN